MNFNGTKKRRKNNRQHSKYLKRKKKRKNPSPSNFSLPWDIAKRHHRRMVFSPAECIQMVSKTGDYRDLGLTLQAMQKHNNCQGYHQTCDRKPLTATFNGPIVLSPQSLHMASWVPDSSGNGYCPLVGPLTPHSGTENVGSRPEPYEVLYRRESRHVKQVQSEEKIREEKNLFKYSSRNSRHCSIHRVLREYRDL